jgi:hypothetical protein
LSVARGNNYQVWWAADAFGLIWKKEKTLELIRKENGSEDLAKQRISNRPLSVDSGTLLRERLGCFLSQQGLILGIDSNCSGGREKRSGCVKKLRNRIKPKFSGGDVSKVRRLLNPGEIVVPTFQNFWSCRPSRHWELPIAGSHWPSGTTDLDGQPTENSEESLFRGGP